MNKSWNLRAERVLYRPFPPVLRNLKPLRDRCPWFFSDAEGAWVVDEHGRHFLDLEMGRGPNLLGYKHPVVVEAVGRHAAIAAKTTLLPTAEVEVAELLVELVPCAELVVFAKNGSDACTGAVRLARAITGREVILSCGFHGFQDWYAATCAWVGGIPADYGRSVRTFELNDLATLERLATENRNRVAAIIIEPAHRELPEPGFLSVVRDLAHRCGALLIFDEVVTAFRLARGGAQEAYGVIPDVACLGKAMANGYPLSALVGRREVMEQLSKTYFSMTFQHDSMALAVAASCLRYLRDNDVAGLVRHRGESLRHAFNNAAIRHGLPARAVGFAARLDLDFPDYAGFSGDLQREIFWGAALEHGLLPATGLFACAALTTADIEVAARGFDRSLRHLADLIQKVQAQTKERISA
jgi:glutamate-1-semialdehyde aminotransferase